MNHATFYAAIRPLFGGGLRQEQVDGCEVLLAATDGLPLTHRAYLLATAYHETAHTMQPVRETLADTDAQAVARLDRAWKAGQLSWVRSPYWGFDQGGKAWFGRGYVQLTHRNNYARAGERLEVDLLGNPSLALQPTVAARILVRGCQEGWFTGKKLGDYLPGDYAGARRVVNGTDRAAQIAEYAKRFEVALSALDASPKAPRAIEIPAQGGKAGTAAGAIGLATLSLAVIWNWACSLSWVAWLFSSCTN